MRRIRRGQCSTRPVCAGLSDPLSSEMKMPGSQSLFDLGNDCRLYIRYSKVHDKRRTFYGLRKTDLRNLEGHRSLICFLWDGQREPLLIPYGEFEDVFAELSPADDGQFKGAILSATDSTGLYLPAPEDSMSRATLAGQNLF